MIHNVKDSKTATVHVNVHANPGTPEYYDILVRGAARYGWGILSEVIKGLHDAHPELRSRERNKIINEIRSLQRKMEHIEEVSSAPAHSLLKLLSRPERLSDQEAAHEAFDYVFRKSLDPLD